jgi:hypothetical protein
VADSARLVRKAEAAVVNPAAEVVAAEVVVAANTAAVAEVVVATVAAAAGKHGFLDFSSLKRRPGGELNLTTGPIFSQANL